MTELKSPKHWANDITVVLNAAFGSDRFPVNIKNVVKDYSHQRFPDEPITLIKGDVLQRFDGAIIPAPSGKKGWGIFYNNAISSEGRINFTLAHEFGHYLVHRHMKPDGIWCDQQDLVRWDSEYGKMEREANEFAATLLMPLDDFRKQIRPKSGIDIDLISHCAERYKVSLIAAILRWLSYTEKRAVLVISRGGFILWARSSELALKTGAFFRTSGPPTEIPECSLAGKAYSVGVARNGMDLPDGTWLPEKGIRELAISSDQYDFTISLLMLLDQPSEPIEDEPTPDSFEQLSNLKWK